MSHFFLRSKHYVLFVPLFLSVLYSWTLQGIYGQKLQEMTQGMQTTGSSDLDFTGFDLADYNGYLYIFIAVSLLSLIASVGWYMAVGKDLKRYLPDHTDFNDKAFGVTLALQVICSLVVIAYSVYGWNWLGENLPTWIANDGLSPGEGRELIMSAITGFSLFALTALIGFGAQVYNSYFAGKTLKSIEEGRPVKGGEVAGYAILSYFLVIGVWIMQPKVNRLVETGNMSTGKEDKVW